MLVHISWITQRNKAQRSKQCSNSSQLSWPGQYKKLYCKISSLLQSIVQTRTQDFGEGGGGQYYRMKPRSFLAPIIDKI